MRKIRVGIMGTGEIARVMAMTLAKTKGVSCSAVGSRTYARAEAFAKEHKIKKAYGSYEELVGDAKLDLIYVATPHSEHFAGAKLAIEARKAVLVEKPFTINEQQAQELIRLARENNVLIAEAIWTRYMPIRARIREVLSTDVIGYPTMLTANLGYPVGQRERMRDPHLGGGAFLDLGIYPLNFASMVFGNDVAEISSVCTRGETGVDQQTGVTLIYRDGRVAQLACTSMALSDRRGVIYGTKGYMIVDNINNPESIEVFDANHKRIQTIKRPKQISGYEYEVYACANAIRKQQIECAEMPHAETIKMLNMMDFIRGQLGLKYPGEEGWQEPAAANGKPAEALAPVRPETTSAGTDASAETEQQAASAPAASEEMNVEPQASVEAMPAEAPDHGEPAEKEASAASPEEAEKERPEEKKGDAVEPPAEPVGDTEG